MFNMYTSPASTRFTRPLPLASGAAGDLRRGGRRRRHGVVRLVTRPELEQLNRTGRRGWGKTFMREAWWREAAENLPARTTPATTALLAPPAPTQEKRHVPVVYKLGGGRQAAAGASLGHGRCRGRRGAV